MKAKRTGWCYAWTVWKLPLVQICFIRHLNAPEDPALRDIGQKIFSKSREGTREEMKQKEAEKIILKKNCQGTEECLWSWEHWELLIESCKAESGSQEPSHDPRQEQSSEVTKAAPDPSTGQLPGDRPTCVEMWAHGWTQWSEDPMTGQDKAAENGKMALLRSF